MMGAALSALIVSASAQLCDPVPLAKEEMREPIVAYLAFWAAIFSPMEKSGIADPSSLFSKERIPDATKRCNAVIAAAGDRKNVAATAKLLLSAYAYVAENLVLEKDQRKRPTDADVAALLGEPRQGLTEGALFTAFLIAQMHFQSAVGLKPPFTEKDIRGRPDVDLSMLGKAPADPAPTGGALPEEVIIKIPAKGLLEVNGKTVPRGELDATLAAIVKRTDERKQKIRVTLQSEEKAKYERITEVMNALAKAKISNVTFTVGTEEL